ncbi:DMT family transporter [Brevibacillus fluminis]|uniref:DMT family transporter n=1 Tax=Brevibacillus fluminis TaxID=511487 RepID=UPI003F8A94E6
MSRTNAMLLLAVILWGATIPPTKWALETVEPLTLTFMRLALSSILFVPYAWKKAKKEQGDMTIPWLRLCSLSFTGVAGYFLFGYTGIAFTSGVNVSIIDSTLPLFTMVFAYFYLKERIVWQQWTGLFIGLTGVLLIALQSDKSNDSSLFGDMMVLAGCIIWAVYIVQMKKPKGEERLPSELFTALLLLIGAAMIFPFAVVEIGVLGWPTFPAKTILSLLYLTIGSSILAYWLWNKAVESVSASKASVYLNFMPVISVIASVLFLKETLTWQTVIGGCLVLTGVVFAERLQTRRALD